MRKLGLLLFSVIVFSLLDVQGQSKSKRTEKYWTIGGQVNALNYFGDLNPLNQFVSTEISFTRPNFGVEISKKISPRVQLRGAFTYGRLRGDDNVAADPNKQESLGRYGRNLHFRNDIFELSFTGTWDLFPSTGRFYRRRYWTPYLLAGIAGYYHNPQAKAPDNAPESAGQWVDLKPLRTEGQGLEGYAGEYSLMQIAFPVGAGVRFRLSDRLDLAFEMGFRILMTDHIDDVGGNYPDIRDLESPLAKIMFDRSAEPIAAVTGDARTFFEGTRPNYGGDLDNPLDAGEEGFFRSSSYGLAGGVRGQQASTQNDLYLVTGFHLNYILTSQRIPKFRRTR